MPGSGQPAGELEPYAEEVVVAVLEGPYQLPGDPGLVGGEEHRRHTVAELEIGAPQLGREELSVELVPQSGELALDFLIEQPGAVGVEPAAELLELREETRLKPLGLAQQLAADPLVVVWRHAVRRMEGVLEGRPVAILAGRHAELEVDGRGCGVRRVRCRVHFSVFPWAYPCMISSLPDAIVARGSPESLDAA